MSLLDGRHLLKVYPGKPGPPDRHGMRTYTWDAPVDVEANVQYLSSSERETLGVQVATVARVLAREWPGGPRTKVFWDGRWWEQNGEALWFTRSVRTSHAEVNLVPTSSPPC